MVAGRSRIFCAFFSASLALGSAAATALAQTASPAWEWNSVAGTQCRDRSPAGFFLRQRPFDKRLVVYLGGGGACFNNLTCSISPRAVGGQAPGAEGIFQERDDNPVSGWNFVHVPYCTGDIYAGSSPGMTVPGVSGKQNFVGFTNMQKILDRLHEMLPDVEEILLTGVSAGGFGANFHYAGTRELWPKSKVVLLDDSGIPLQDEWLAPCLQQKFRKFWGIDAALPVDCPECKTANGGGLVEMVNWLRSKYPDIQKGVVLSTQDSTLRFMFGFGLNECKPPLIPSISAKNYEAAISSLKEHYLDQGFVSFMMAGTQHTFIEGKGFYSTKLNGQILSAWVQDLLNGQAVDRTP